MFFTDRPSLFSDARFRPQARMRTLDEKIASSSARAPPRPTERRVDDIEAEIQGLEWQRSTTTMTLMEEKNLLKQIALVKQGKHAWDELNTFRDNVTKMRTERSEGYNELGNLRTSIRELKDGIHKVEVFQKIKAAEPDRDLTPGDIVDIEVAVPAEQVGNVIGRGGARCREIQDECLVFLNIDKKTNVVRISGTEDGTAKARALVEEATSAISERIELPEEMRLLLVSRKGVHLKSLQAEYRVYIDLDRANNQAVLRGGAEVVAKAKAALLDLFSGHTAVDIPERLIPTVIGKGGATIERLQEDR